MERSWKVYGSVIYSKIFLQLLPLEEWLLNDVAAKDFIGTQFEKEVKLYLQWAVKQTADAEFQELDTMRNLCF